MGIERPENDISVTTGELVSGKEGIHKLILILHLNATFFPTRVAECL